jgi:hypothetical protein
MVLPHNFATFWDGKFWRKKNIFSAEKICKSFDEKKTNEKPFFFGKNRVNPLKKKREKSFFLWKNNSKSSEKRKKPYRKNANCVIRTGHAPRFCNARENACPLGWGEFTVSIAPCTATAHQDPYRSSQGRDNRK